MYKVIYPHQFADGPSVRTVTRDFTKIASHVPSELIEALAALEKKAGKTYLIVNALGAEEFYGSNVNGDSFPEASLMSKSASYGYKTFEKFAKVYRHHLNKDPEKAMGEVKCAAYNSVMHRVELLLEIDNQLGSSLIEKVAAGEFPDWSMGCKVPWDQCTSCMHKAATVKEYCPCLRERMNKIAENGVRICARNVYPKFFDISEVIVGADKTAKMFRKVASAVGLSSAAMGLEVYGEDQEKMAEPKTAEMEKEILTETPNPRLEAAVAGLQSYEPSMPKAVIKKLASFPLGEALSTLSYSGVLLKPGEFQSLVLENSGQGKLAEDLEAKGIELPVIGAQDVGAVVEADTTLISPDLVKRAAFEAFEDFVPHRSIYEPYIHERLDRVSLLPLSRMKTAARRDYSYLKTASVGLLDLMGPLALSYFLYRKSFPTETIEIEKMMAKHPWMTVVALGGAVGAVNMVDMIAGPTVPQKAHALLQNAQVKTGGVGANFAKMLGTIIGPVGLAYLTAASAKRKELEGYELNPLETTARDYPAPIGTAGALGLIGLRKMLRK